MEFDVFFFEAFEEEAAALRRLLPDEVRAGFTWRTIQEYGADAPPARLISTRTQSILPPAWASRLAGILTRSTGYDHVAAYRRTCPPPVEAGYLPLYCNRSVAEQAMLLWMALLRKLPRQLEQFRAFNRDGLTGRECLGKTILVVGVGHIGIEVVRLAAGIGMHPLAVDLVRRHKDVTYVAFDEGASQADIVVCSMNLTADNRGYFGDARLRRLKRGAVFVNIARGELADPGALLRLLDEGHLGGVGLDVYDSEPQLAVALRRSDGAPADASAAVSAALALAAHRSAICLPHNAFNTEEAVERKARQSVEAIRAFLTDGTFPHPIPEA